MDQAVNTLPALQITTLQHSWMPSQRPLFELADLRLNPGESLFIHGPSGCGKSTLLSLICGITQAQQGEVRIQGRDWRSLNGHRRDAWRADHIGYVFQQFNLLPYLNALENVTLPCSFSKKRQNGCHGQGGIHMAAQSLLKRMHLPEATWRMPSSTLSVGQQQRVAAARALIGSPSLVVADEPTSALDETTRDAFMQVFLGACNDAKAAMIFVSHDHRLIPHFQRSVSWQELVKQSL